MLMTDPAPRRAISVPNTWQTRSAPCALTSSTPADSSSGMSPKCQLPPSAAGGPTSPRQTSSAASRLSRSVTSAGTRRNRSPWGRDRSLLVPADDVVAAGRSSPTTRAPAPSSASVQTLPSLPSTPVTTATLPERSVRIGDRPLPVSPWPPSGDHVEVQVLVRGQRVAQRPAHDLGDQVRLQAVAGRLDGDVRLGQQVTGGQVAIKSPGDGLKPYLISEVVGRPLRNPLPADEDLHLDMV